MTEKDIIQVIKRDGWMMDVLTIVAKLKLPDWWIGAGFVRSKVWDTLQGNSIRTPIPDIDVIYFDPKDYLQDEAQKETTGTETNYESLLKKQRPEINWSVTNQARMHFFHKQPPYKNSVDALSNWIETPTCIAVKINEKDELVFAAPLGIDDLVNLIVRPNLKAYPEIDNFRERMKQKKWIEKWPKLKIVMK